MVEKPTLDALVEAFDKEQTCRKSERYKALRTHLLEILGYELYNSIGWEDTPNKNALSFTYKGNLITVVNEPAGGRIYQIYRNEYLCESTEESTLDTKFLAILASIRNSTKG